MYRISMTVMGEPEVGRFKGMMMVVCIRRHTEKGVNRPGVRIELRSRGLKDFGKMVKWGMGFGK